MIIVEGPDNTGKTTLIKKLIDDFDLILYPKLKMNGNIIKDKMNIYSHYRQINKFLDSSEKILHLTIFDRCYFSELVYGRLFREVISINSTDLVDIPIKIKDANPLIIYCSISTVRIIENYREREQYAPISNVPRIVQTYKNALPFMKLLVQDEKNFIKYDYRKIKYEEIKKQVERYLKEVNSEVRNNI